MSILLSSFLFLACESEIDNKPQAEIKPVSEKLEKQETVAAVKSDAAVGGLSLKNDTKIGFVGAKLTGDHSGEFKKFSGSAEIKDGKVISLKADIDLASVETDHPKLTGHLKHADFFDVEKYTTSTFTSTKIEDAKISGILDFHGVKNEISFPAEITVSGDDVKIVANFNINRQLWKLSYPGKKDDAIKDDVLIKLNAHYAK